MNFDFDHSQNKLNEARVIIDSSTESLQELVNLVSSMETFCENNTVTLESYSLYSLYRKNIISSLGYSATTYSSESFGNKITISLEEDRSFIKKASEAIKKVFDFIVGLVKRVISYIFDMSNKVRKNIKDTISYLNDFKDNFKEVDFVESDNPEYNYALKIISYYTYGADTKYGTDKHLPFDVFYSLLQYLQDIVKIIVSLTEKEVKLGNANFILDFRFIGEGLRDLKSDPVEKYRKIVEPKGISNTHSDNEILTTSTGIGYKLVADFKNRHIPNLKLEKEDENIQPISLIVTIGKLKKALSIMEKHVLDLSSYSKEISTSITKDLNSFKAILEKALKESSKSDTYGNRMALLNIKELNKVVNDFSSSFNGIIKLQDLYLRIMDISCANIKARADLEN